MRKRWLAGAAVAAFLALAGGAYAVQQAYQAAVPNEFDPGRTHLVNASWLPGVGCPVGEAYTDPACAADSDARDKRNEGLLLAKTGPTSTAGSAYAVLRGVKGETLSELGYDLRKPTAAADPRGSHCGAGAPRFNVTTADGTRYFIGCNSPPAEQAAAGLGWIRLRWGATTPLLGYNAATGVLENLEGVTVESITVLFDEGQDVGPDAFGAAILDNIDVNGTLVGRGATDAG